MTTEDVDMVVRASWRYPTDYGLRAIAADALAECGRWTEEEFLRCELLCYVFTAGIVVPLAFPPISADPRLTRMERGATARLFRLTLRRLARGGYKVLSPLHRKEYRETLLRLHDDVKALEDMVSGIRPDTHVTDFAIRRNFCWKETLRLIDTLPVGINLHLLTEW